MKRADKILEQLHRNEQLKVDKLNVLSRNDKDEDTSMCLEPGPYYVVSETNNDRLDSFDENIENGAQRKRKISLEDSETETVHTSSPSVIEATPQKSDCYRKYLRELRNERKNASRPEAISITRKRLKFQVDELQKECEENPQEKHSLPLITLPESTDKQQHYRNDNEAQSPLTDKCEAIYPKNTILGGLGSSPSPGTSSSRHGDDTHSMLEEPSTSKGVYHATIRSPKDYRISPINTDESDADLSDADPTYRRRPRSRFEIVCRRSCSSSSSSNSSSNSSLSSSSSDPAGPSSAPRATSPVGTAAATDLNVTRKSRKRQRNPQAWKQNIAKTLRNTGKEYVSHAKSKKIVPARCVKKPCTNKCRLKCAVNISEADRKTIFKSYWGLSDIELQRSFIRNSMVEVKPKYKYTNAERPRNPNCAFYFTVNSIKVRVCKCFFINTLDICDKVIRTVKNKTDAQGFIEKDQRGKNEENRKKIDPKLIEDIRNHINSIPRIESHYLRSSTSREYIGGEKTIKDLWRDFDKDQRDAGKPSCLYWLYYDIFNKDFNLGFFQPKKDRCDLCFEYELAPPDRKLQLQEKYDKHLKEKKLSRNEKLIDRQNVDETHIVAVFDLQAVMQCPSGDTSAFYYRSKLNCLNFTIVELSQKISNVNVDNSNHHDIGAYSEVYSYFWDETQAQRGANEIASCILNYLEILNAQHEGKAIHVTFYSDNCCGQNKNKFITTLYSYAVYKLQNIYSITQKYLIKGHTQNEGDSVHSLIEKEIQRHKKSGPVYAPCQYVMLIKNSRKNGKPFNVKELTFDFFKDFKKFQENWAYNFNEAENKQNLTWNDIKILKFTKQDLLKFYFKTSFSQTEFTGVDMRNKRRKMPDIENIMMTKAYSKAINLSKRKHDDLSYLVENNLIPHYYAYFYKSLLSVT